MIRKNYQSVTFLLTLFLSAYSPSLLAENVFERAMKKIDDTIEDRNTEAPKPKNINPAKLASIPTDLPAHWRLKILHEPIFDSEILIAEVGDKNKPPIILVHGLGQLGMRDWLTVVPALEQDFFVIALDLPGFGSSGKPQGRYSPTNYAKIIAHIKQRYSPNTAINIVGHSMGGAVSLRYSYLYPVHINKIILVDAAGILQRTAFVKHSADFSNSKNNLPKILSGIINGTQDVSGNLIEILNTLPDPSILVSNDKIWGKAFAGRTNINAAFALIEEDFSNAIYQNKHHIGLIWGEDDRIAPLRTGKLLEHNLAQAQLRVISKAGHVPMKSHQEQFNRHLSDLLNIKYTNPIPETINAQALHCKNKSGQNVSGIYSSIVIENCNDIKLVDVKARSISITDSRAELENITLYSDATALSLKKSVAIATNLNITGLNGIHLNASRIDLAGSSIIANQDGITTKEKSRLVLSVSRLKDQNNTGNLHGLYKQENEVFVDVINVGD